MTDFEKLEADLGHRFADRGLLTLALTHKSVEASPSNERLEFLGDRVLGLVIADWLYRNRSGSREGVLAVRLNGLVRRETLAAVAAELRLGRHLILSKGESDQGGRAKAALLANALEAILGAVYLDAGFETARALVERLWADYLSEKAAPIRDAKTALQEIAAARNLGLPNYVECGRTGPDHAPVFEVAVELDGSRCTATGTSKRVAEQAAAKLMLARIDGEGPNG